MFIGCVLGRFHVPSIEFWAIIAMLGLSSLFSIYAQYRITQIAASSLAARVEELNLALGEAIQLVQTGTQAAENPLVAIISKVLDQQIDKPLSAKVVEQDEFGKFVKKIE